MISTFIFTRNISRLYTCHLICVFVQLLLNVFVQTDLNYISIRQGNCLSVVCSLMSCDVAVLCLCPYVFSFCTKISSLCKELGWVTIRGRFSRAHKITSILNNTGIVTLNIVHGSFR